MSATVFPVDCAFFSIIPNACDTVPPFFMKVLKSTPPFNCLNILYVLLPELFNSSNIALIDVPALAVDPFPIVAVNVAIVAAVC